jgi:hypothetical protein
MVFQRGVGSSSNETAVEFGTLFYELLTSTRYHFHLAGRRSQRRQHLSNHTHGLVHSSLFHERSRFPAPTLSPQAKGDGTPILNALATVCQSVSQAPRHSLHGMLLKRSLEPRQASLTTWSCSLGIGSQFGKP